MYSDGRRLDFRARTFLAELKKQTYPNATTLGKLCKCSAKTSVL